MDDQLREISATLDALIHNKEAQVFTFVPTGYDETAMVATADGYLRFARSLVDFVVAARAGGCENVRSGEIVGPGSADVGNIFNWLSDVELDSTTLVQTELEAEQAIRYHQAQSPQDEE